MLEILKTIASHLFYLIWSIILLDGLIIAIAGCLFVTNAAIREWFGIDIIEKLKEKR